MKTTRKTLITLTGLLGLGLATATLVAAPYGPGREECPMGGGGFGPGHGPGMGRGMGGAMQAPGEFHAARIEELKSRLALTEAQIPAWERVVELMNSHHADRSRMREELFADQADLTAPERMDHRISRMSDGLARMQAMRTELQAFYDVLDAGQRETLDRFALMGKGPRHGF